MYSIVYSESAAKFIRKLDKTIQQRILTAIERIRIRPADHTTRLVGSDFYKFRVGDYRIILDVDNGKLIILVIEIGHRENIYDKLPN